MPLEPGSSSETIRHNIEEMMKSWRETGKIGNTHPKSEKKAREIAEAAAYSKAKRAVTDAALGLVQRARSRKEQS